MTLNFYLNLYESKVTFPCLLNADIRHQLSVSEHLDGTAGSSIDSHWSLIFSSNRGIQVGLQGCLHTNISRYSFASIRLVQLYMTAACKQA